jgi:hypothetical protein
MRWSNTTFKSSQPFSREVAELPGVALTRFISSIGLGAYIVNQYWEEPASFNPD